MRSRAANALGAVTTVIAGVVLARFSISAFGPTPTLFAFLALAVLATVVSRVTPRQ